MCTLVKMTATFTTLTISFKSVYCSCGISKQNFTEIIIIFYELHSCLKCWFVAVSEAEWKKSILFVWSLSQVTNPSSSSFRGHLFSGYLCLGPGHVPWIEIPHLCWINHRYSLCKGRFPLDRNFSVRTYVKLILLEKKIVCQIHCKI